MKHLKLFEDVKKELEELSNKINSFDLETQYKDVKEIQDFSHSKLKEIRYKKLYKKNKNIIDKIDNVLKNSTLKNIIKDLNLEDTDVFNFNKKYENIFRRKTLTKFTPQKINIDELTIEYRDNDGMEVYIKIEQMYDKETDELLYKMYIQTSYRYVIKKIETLLNKIFNFRPYNIINKEELYELLKNIKDIINKIDLELKLQLYNL